MPYTLMLTEKTEGGITVTVPAVCTVEATTRDAAIFDVAGTTVLERCCQPQRRRQRSADLMSAARVIAGHPILVTRNQADVAEVLPPTQLATWLDAPPGASLP